MFLVKSWYVIIAEKRAKCGWHGRKHGIHLSVKLDWRLAATD